MTQDEKSWFNTVGDFNGTTRNAFRWNEFERMIVETYQNEPDEKTKEAMTNRVIAFWDKHIPILISCRNFYCYVAICLRVENYGQIIYGSEPEFEETETIANDFPDFMNKLTTRTLNKDFIDKWHIK